MGWSLTNAALQPDTLLSYLSGPHGTQMNLCIIEISATHAVKKSVTLYSVLLTALHATYFCHLLPVFKSEDSTMGNGLWFITILKEQPWIGIGIGILLFGLVFLLKKWLVKKMMGSEEES
ncbi:MAG: hypothetical protein P8179_23510 [Candidatus Thiodiazotropha sp.]|jgi:hypothetical protein